MSERSKYLLLLMSVIIIDLIIWFAVSSDSYYNKIELNEVNIITNKTKYSYMDTVVSVGLDKINVSGVSVVITELTDDIRQKFEQAEPLTLNAAIVGTENQFIIYVSNMGRKDCIVPLAHELIHLKQYNTGQLKLILPDKILWDGVVLDSKTVKSIPYGDRGWEKMAFQLEYQLSDLIEDELYEND